MAQVTTSLPIQITSKLIEDNHGLDNLMFKMVVPQQLIMPSDKLKGMAGSQLEDSKQDLLNFMKHSIVNTKSLRQYKFDNISLNSVAIVYDEKWRHLSVIDLCMYSKESSLWVQRIFDQSSHLELDKYFQKLRPHLGRLIRNSCGCYVLQKLILLSESCRQNLQVYCCINIDQLCQNEYASRVMQKLTDLDSAC